MWTRAAIVGFLTLCGGGARADFSLICDEQSQLEDVLRTDQASGFEEATTKFKAYIALKDERDEATCGLGRPPHPAKVGKVVASFESIEFMPGELHDVLVVELHMGGRVLYGTINRFVSEKKPEQGT